MKDRGVNVKMKIKTFGVVVAGLVVAACGGSSSPAATVSSPVVSSPVPSAVVPARAPSGPSVTMTVGGGYIYQVSLAAPIQAKTSFTTDNGSGIGGTAIDAPPGHILFVATITITNKTDRQEPDEFITTEPLPIAVDPATQADFPVMVVPPADAAAFGLIPDCGYANFAGDCTLNPGIGAFSPALAGVQAPQLAVGDSGSITLFSRPLPEGAPVQDVKVFVPKDASCVFDSSTACWLPLN
jgi:hypothetical protein